MTFVKHERCYDQAGWMFIKAWYKLANGKLVYFVEE